MFDHVKFGVRDFALSKRFYVKALESMGVTDVTDWPPGLRPQYSGRYCAAFVLDPDVHNIEWVYHELEA
ncbi:MAG: hypothetical protein ACR2QS_01320 [Woeseiaceae bacterium]